MREGERRRNIEKTQLQQTVSSKLTKLTKLSKLSKLKSTCNED